MSILHKSYIIIDEEVTTTATNASNISKIIIEIQSISENKRQSFCFLIKINRYREAIIGKATSITRILSVMYSPIFI